MYMYNFCAKISIIIYIYIYIFCLLFYIKHKLKSLYVSDTS